MYLINSTHNFKFRFMTNDEHDNENSFNNNCKNRIVLNFASKMDNDLVSFYGASTNISSKKSYSGIIAYSPNLILDNIDNSSNSIEFLINGYKKVDYHVAVYFSISLIKLGRLPKYYKELLDYIESCEEEKVIFDSSNKINLFSMISIIEFIPEVETIENKNERLIKIFERGLEIIDYAHKRLEKVSKIIPSDFFDKSIFRENDDFPEIDRILKDYNDYIEDTTNDKIYQVSFDAIDFNGNLKLVEALVFKESKTCLFGAYWSRNDSRAPSGKGYDVIVSPEKLYSGKKSMKRSELEHDLSKKNISLNRYRINCNINSGINLKGLGMYLELYEQLKEESAFDFDRSKLEIWRNSGPKNLKRYKESKWSKSQYPWYDGRNHEYSFVDSPTVDSLLTLDEVVELLANYSNEYIEELELRYIFSFTYDYDEKNELEENLLDHPRLNLDFLTDDHYFLDNFNTYFRTKNSISLKSFSLNTLNFKSFKDLLADEINSNLRTSSVEHKLIDEYFEFSSSIYSFSYGVGFIEVGFKSVKPLPFTVLYTSNIENINRKLYNPKNEVISSFIIDNRIFSKSKSIDCLNCNSYHQITPYEPILNSNIKSRIIDRTTNYYNEKSIKEYVRTSSINKDYSIGITQKGTSIIKREISNKIDVDEKENIFHLRLYLIYIFVLHQRQALLRFSERLYFYDREDNKKEIRQLRVFLLKFITQSWFSQITEDNLGMHLYNQWSETLETEKLLEEMYSQTTALDEFNRNSITNIIEKVSFIGLPIVALSTIFGMNLLETKGIYLRLEYVIILIISLFSGGVYILKKFRVF